MSRGSSIDLNADIGEGCGFDLELVPLVSSVNIACGAHAGDERTMAEAIGLAQRSGAAIGAHPGFADREHFGRKERAVSPGEAAALVLDQLGLIRRVARGLNAKVGHVKLHGALYNMASRDRLLAQGLVEALVRDGRKNGEAWVLVALAGSALASVGAAAGLRVVGEAFADRGYGSDGLLLPRSEPGSVIKDEERAADQALGIVRDGKVYAPGGAAVAVDAETLCIHGDSTLAAALARAIRSRFESAGIRIERWPEA